ncbi:hypothetical protein ABZ920_15585 [Streptomyces sp. NPDC046831]|uniref:hypothetical protein n=1 Tax=Streptomyces sp. NPDC046831 TaxID=3154805 RepID=UPI0033FBA0D4
MSVNGEERRERERQEPAGIARTPGDGTAPADGPARAGAARADDAPGGDRAERPDGGPGGVGAARADEGPDGDAGVSAPPHDAEPAPDERRLTPVREPEPAPAEEVEPAAVDEPEASGDKPEPASVDGPGRAAAVEPESASVDEPGRAAAVERESASVDEPGRAAAVEPGRTLVDGSAAPRPPEQEHTQSHAGNDTVNHSPDEKDLEGFDSDELALRRLLHQAVEDIGPRDGTLDHLRRAVPARRARKRQAAVGMAAAALFIGTAVPALVHVSNSTGSDANPAIAGQASQAQGGTGGGKGPDGGSRATGGPDGKSTEKGRDGTADGRRGDKGAGTGGGSAGGTEGPSASQGDTPACTSSQLGSASATVDPPDSAGAVYGTFRIGNVSGQSCAVGGSGTVSPLAQGAADPAGISVVTHSSGDAAAGLPDPSNEVPGLVLKPGASYVVKFAWVPSQTCPTAGGGSTGGPATEDPSPDPTPSQPVSSTGSTTSSGETGTATQLVRVDGPADGGVVVSYTADGGGPTVSATVSNACAGTVYRTGVLPAS